MNFLSCTPEQPTKVGRGTKRKAMQTEHSNDTHERNPSTRRSKRKKDNSSKGSENDILNREAEVRSDDDILLLGDDMNDELLNYLENGSCGAVFENKNISGNCLDPALTVGTGEKKIKNTRRRTRSAEKSNKDIKTKIERILLSDKVSPHKSHDIRDDQMDLKEDCNETGDAKNIIWKNLTANVREGQRMPSNNFNNGKTVSIETRHCEDNHNTNMSTKNTRNNRKNTNKNNQENREKTENLQISANRNSEQDVLINGIQTSENETKVRNSQNFDDILFNDIEINENESNLYCEKLREQKTGKSMKELSDSWSKSSEQMSSQSLVSDKTSENGEFFNKTVPKIQKTYSRKLNGQPKNDARREKTTDVNRVKEWIKNLPEKKDVSENGSSGQITPVVEIQPSMNIRTEINDFCDVNTDNESEDNINVLPENSNVNMTPETSGMKLNTKEGETSSVCSVDVDNKSLHDKIRSQLRTRGGIIHSNSCSVVEIIGDNSGKISSFHCADVDNKDGENFLPVIPQRKRIFKSTRATGVHDHVTIKQCKGTLSFKVVNTENADKPSKVHSHTQYKKNAINKKNQKEIQPFVLDKEENKQEVNKNDESKKHLTRPDAGQESDPYEFKSSQKTPVRDKSKNKKLKNKKAHKKGQLHIRFVENSKKDGESNPVEIISDDEDDPDDKGRETAINQTCKTGESSVKDVTDNEVKGGLDVDSERVQPKEIKSRKGKKQKCPKLTFTQKDFDDLEKLKDKISDAEDYDLLTSTQEASEKILKEQESENIHEIDTIPDSECIQNSEKMKTKKKVSFCNNVNVIKHCRGTGVVNKDEVKILKKSDSPSPATVIQEIQSVNKHIKHSNDDDTQMFGDHGGKDKSVSLLKRDNEFDMKILKKNDSPSVVSVIHETQNVNQVVKQVSDSDPGFKVTDKHAEDHAFKNPANIELSKSKKSLKSKGTTLVRLEEVRTSDRKNKQSNEVGVCTDNGVYNHEEEDIDSSGTDDLDVEPSQEEFETINLDIQPKEIIEKLSQDMNSQCLVKTSENAAQYKSPLRNLPSKFEKAVPSVQETPLIQTDETTSNNLKSISQGTLHKVENSENQTSSRKKFTKKKINTVTDMTENATPTISVVEETPIVSVVKETPAVSMKTSVSLVKETQLSSAQMSESPLPESECISIVTQVPSMSSLETEIGESQTLPSFVVNQMETENSNIQETHVLASCETGTEDTQQSVSILTLPNKIHQEALLGDTQSQLGTHSNNLSTETKENLENDQDICHVKKELKEKKSEGERNKEKSDLALNTKRNKLKKKKSKSPSVSSVETIQMNGSYKKGDNLNFSDYVPATEGASWEDTQIIPIVVLENLEKNSETVPESLSCKLTTPASVSENDIVHKHLTGNNCMISGPVLPSNENHNEKTNRLKNLAGNHLDNAETETEVVVVKCEENKDSETQESVAEDIQSTLVSLQTIKKMEKSLSKNSKCSPEDIFMLDSESLTEGNHFDDGDDNRVPQNQEGICFMSFNDSESKFSLKQSQEKKDFERAKDTIDMEPKAKIDICENKNSEINQNVCDRISEEVQSENRLGENSLSASASKIKDRVTEINDSMLVTQVGDSIVKSASESQEKVCSSSKFIRSRQDLKEKDSESDSENAAELKRVKVKTKRGLAKRINLSASEICNNSIDSEMGKCLVIKETKTSNRENKTDVIDSDLENEKCNEEFIVSNSVPGKVSPKFLNSPQKRFTPSKGNNLETLENIENIQRSFTPKRTSLTFIKRPTKSGRHRNMSQDSVVLESQMSRVKESADSCYNDDLNINVVSESQMSKDKEPVDPSYHYDANKEVISESQLSRVEESAYFSHHDDITDVTTNRIIDKENEIQLEKKSRKQVRTDRIGSRNKSGKGNMITSDDEINDSDTSVKIKNRKKKRVKPVESSSSEDEDFDRSSPLPDIFGNKSKSEAESKARQNAISSSEDEEFVLVTKQDEQELVLPGGEKNGNNSEVKHQDDKIIKQVEDIDSDVVMVSQTSAQLFSDDEEDMDNDVINGGSNCPIKSDIENEDSETEIVVRNRSGKNRNIITDDSSSDDESLQDSSQQMNMTSSSAFSSQSEAMTTQKKEDLERDLERMRKQILDLEAQLSATKQSSSSSKKHRVKRSQNSDSSNEDGSIRKRSKRQRVAVRCLDSDSSDDDNDGCDKVKNGDVREIGEDGEEKADTEIQQYPSSGDESDELCLTPLPPSPPPPSSQEQLTVQTYLPAQVKETDEFLKKVLKRDQVCTSELSSPISSQLEFPPFDFPDNELPKKRKNKKQKGEIFNSESDKELKRPRHSSPYVTKMDLKISKHSTPLQSNKSNSKNSQHSTPLRYDEINSKTKESPMFAHSQRSKDTVSRTVLSPLVNNDEIKEERITRHKCFVASSLQIEQMKEIQKLAIMNDCKFHTKFSPSVTHVIVNTKPFGSRVCDRTLKFFQGLANKCWIMDYQWVIDSRKAGYLLPEDNYEIKGDTVTTDNHNGPRRVRLSRKPLFENFQICIISTSDGLTPDNLTELFTTCHGEVVADIKDFSTDTTNFIVTCTDYDEESPTDEEIKIFNRYYRLHRVLTITREWVLDSLTLNTIQPLNDYVLTCVKGMTIPDLR